MSENFRQSRTGVGGLNGQIDTIVFLTRRPISKFEEEKWGFAYLRDRGFKLEVFDCTQLLYRDKKTCESVTALVQQALQGDYIHQFNSYCELELSLKRLAVSSLFVDYIMGNLDVTLKEERIFRLLKKYKARYTFVSAGTLPVPSMFITNNPTGLKAFKRKLMKAVSNPSLLFNYLASKVILLLTRHHIFYPLPMMIFGGHSEILQSYLANRNIKSKVIPINSFDYDTCIAYTQQEKNIVTEKEDICVFLDEAATHHPDNSMLGIEAASPEIYFSAIKSFFNFIEENTGYRVVIAAHPRSNYESLGAPFGERQIIKGKTAELVAKSKLVVMHASTSLSYAVFFRKPIIFLKVPGLSQENHVDRMVEAMANIIGNTPIDLMKDAPTPTLLQCKYAPEKYNEYESRYIKTDEAEALPVWAIVTKSIENMQLCQ